MRYIRASMALIIATLVTSSEASTALHHPLPIVFERIEQAATTPPAYRARTAGYELLIDSDGAAFVVPDSKPVRMRFIGAASHSGPVPVGPSTATLNYLLGNDPQRWRTGVPAFQKVGHTDLYPGVDLVYYPVEGAIEFDLIVAPGASPDVIRLCLEGGEPRITDEGDLAIGEILMRRPHIYQKTASRQLVIDGRYVITPTHEVRFELEEFDSRKPLIIDPVVVRHSTYLGGSQGDDAFGVAIDGNRNIYVTGMTHSADFVSTDGSLQPTIRGGSDIFLTKLSPDGRLTYSTFIGGTDSERGGPGSGDGWNDVAVDTAGNVYLTGTTRSRDFPVTAQAAQREFHGGPDDAFVAKLSPDGQRLIYSTYLGGSGEDQARAIGIHTDGSAYVTGRTMSHDFPSVRAFQPQHGGGVDAFITRISPDGSAIVFSSFLGGSNLEVGRDIAVDAAGSAYVAGRTLSPNFPATAGAFQTTMGGIGALGQGDGFAAKVRADGTLSYATFLGGARGEIAAGIDVDSSGHAYVSGLTESHDFPTTAGSVQPHYAGGAADGFLTKLDPFGASLIYSTFIGGPEGDEECFSVAVDTSGQAYIAGTTFSRTFPTVSAFQPNFVGPISDAFVAKLDASGSHFLYSSFLGGNGVENAFRIAVDNGGNACTVGGTRAPDFPTTSSALQRASGGNGDGFVACIAHYEEPANGVSRIIPAVGSTPGSHGSFFRTSFQLHNATDTSIRGILDYRHAGSSDVSATLPYILGARQTLAFANLLDVMGISGVGSAELRFEAAQEPVVVARIFQDAGEAGTSGMSEIPLAREDALFAGQEGTLLAPIDPEAARLNLGMRALDEGAEIRFIRRSATGEITGSASRILAANVLLQMSAGDLFGAALDASDSITVYVDRGSAFVYGSTNDNFTNDPSLQFAVRVMAVEGEKRIVPVIGSIRGAFGSNFKTSAQLHNPTNDELRGRLLFRYSDGGREETMEYALSPHATSSWEDLPASMGVSGLGTLELHPEGGLPPLALMRIYNDLEEAGTTGMGVEALREGDALKINDVAILIAPPDPMRARFNIGIVARDAGTELAITVRDHAGSIVRQTDITVAPRALIQAGAGSLLGVLLGNSDTIEIEVRSGSAFIYGATTDNKTNDPSLQFARRVRPPG
jgi:hypothetical protein